MLYHNKPLTSKDVQEYANDIVSTIEVLEDQVKELEEQLPTVSAFPPSSRQQSFFHQLQQASFRRYALRYRSEDQLQLKHQNWLTTLFKD